MQNRRNDVPYLGCSNIEGIKNPKDPGILQERLEILYHFITERYKIWLRRNSGQERPWTDDEILRDFSFTNIRREQDRTSRWLIEHISENDDLSIADKFWQTILFRLYNKIETAELFKLGSDFDWDFERIEEARSKSDMNNLFTTAYFMSGCKAGWNNKYPDIPKSSHLSVLKGIIDYRNNFDYSDVDSPVRYFDNDYHWNEDLHADDVVNWFFKIPGCSWFTVYQLFVDLTYIPSFPISENEYVVAGPGCRTGIWYLTETPKWKESMVGDLKYEEFLFWLRDHLEDLFRERVDPNFSCDQLFTDLPPEERHFNVMSLENVFCEFSKYMKLKEMKETGKKCRIRKYYHNSESIL